MATTKDIRYPAEDVTAHGMFAEPDGAGRVPGIALFADIRGVNEQTREWAPRIADELGYLALAADVYGGGQTITDFAVGMQWIGALLAEPDRLVGRARGALAALAAHPRCDGRLGAIGFCFGGSTVLALARGGTAELAAGVSFHGGLKTAKPAQAGNIPTRLLVLHGVADPMDDIASLGAFLAEMEAARADCQTIAYTGIGHSFTNPLADGSRGPGLKYDALTTQRAWRAMAAHFAESFAA